MSFPAVVGLLLVRRKLIAFTTVVFVLLGILACILIKPSFTAVTIVMPPSDATGGLGGLSSVTTVLSLGRASNGDLSVKLFESHTIEDALIQQFHLQKVYRVKLLSDARRALEARSKISLDEKSNLVTISVTDGNAQFAADLANGYVQDYQNLSARLAVTQASRKRQFFSDQLLQAKNNLADAEEKLLETQKKTGFLQPDSQTPALIGSAANLRAEIASKHVQMEAMRNFATAENPQMQQAQSELNGLEGQLASLESSSSGTNSLIMPKNAVENGGVEYIRRLRDVKYFETLYDMLARQLETARLEEAREGSGIEVVDPAVPPDRKSGPKRSLILVGSFVFGFVGSCCWVLGGVAYQDLRRRLREMEASSSSPV
jgi:tyrosine-protein kinase Etk/Wzc